MHIESIYFSYKSKDVLKGINADFKEGMIYCIAGHNGAGKTTFLRLCLGLLTPKRGRIITKYKKMGYMPEKNGIFQNLTIRQNIKFFMSINKSSADIDRLLAEWNLEHVSNSLAANISTGQQKRLSFLMMDIQDPDILFLDEPTSGLDISTQKLFIKRIKDLKRKKKTIIMTSHDANLIKEICDEVLILNNGEKVFEGDISLKDNFMEFYSKLTGGFDNAQFNY